MVAKRMLLDARTGEIRAEAEGGFGAPVSRSKGGHALVLSVGLLSPSIPLGAGISG